MKKMKFDKTVVVLLSGGLDSPVAAYQMIKKGYKVILCHFQNVNTLNNQSIQDKVIQLAQQLSKYQAELQLYIIPFHHVQQEIIIYINAKDRMLCYKAYMFRLASYIAKKHHSHYLVVGDALGQVASQTLQNMQSLYQISPLPILTPLLGYNKDKIKEIAREIGTETISNLPYGDCCSYFLASHPSLFIERYQLIELFNKIENKSTLDLQCLSLHFHAIYTNGQCMDQNKTSLIDILPSKLNDDETCKLTTRKRRSVYLDNAATTSLHPKVVQYMQYMLNHSISINPSNIQLWKKLQYYGLQVITKALNININTKLPPNLFIL